MKLYSVLTTKSTSTSTVNTQHTSLHLSRTLAVPPHPPVLLIPWNTGLPGSKTRGATLLGKWLKPKTVKSSIVTAYTQPLLIHTLFAVPHYWLIPPLPRSPNHDKYGPCTFNIWRQRSLYLKPLCSISLSLSYTLGKTCSLVHFPTPVRTCHSTGYGPWWLVNVCLHYIAATSSTTMHWDLITLCTLHTAMRSNEELH
jgi:hypothetical protein